MVASAQCSEEGIGDKNSPGQRTVITCAEMVAVGSHRQIADSLNLVLTF